MAKKTKKAEQTAIKPTSPEQKIKQYGNLVETTADCPKCKRTWVILSDYGANPNKRTLFSCRDCKEGVITITGLKVSFKRGKKK